MNGNIKKDRRKISRTCCSLDAKILLDQKTFTGRIENMSNSGAVVLTDGPVRMTEGDDIRLTVACDGRKDVLAAKVMWSDKSAFGVKFII